MQKGFNTYFLHLFGPKLSITSKNFWNCLQVCLGSETVCPEKDRQAAFYSPLGQNKTQKFTLLWADHDILLRWVEDGSWGTGSGSALVATTPMVDRSWWDKMLNFGNL